MPELQSYILLDEYKKKLSGVETKNVISFITKEFEQKSVAIAKTKSKVVERKTETLSLIELEPKIIITPISLIKNPLLKIVGIAQYKSKIDKSKVSILHQVLEGKLLDIKYKPNTVTIIKAYLCFDRDKNALSVVLKIMSDINLVYKFSRCIISAATLQSYSLVPKLKENSTINLQSAWVGDKPEEFTERELKLITLCSEIFSKIKTTIPLMTF
jgi:hypothetical protein